MTFVSAILSDLDGESSEDVSCYASDYAADNGAYGAPASGSLGETHGSLDV